MYPLLLASLLVVASCATSPSKEASAPRVELSVDKMTQCYKKLDGFALKEGYWLFPADRGGKYGFYAFNADSAYFSVFPVDPMRKIKTKFTEFPGDKGFGKAHAPSTRYYAIQWTLPDRKPAWFWLDVNDTDMTQSHFGQATSAAGKAFQEVVTAKIPEGTRERQFTGALRDYLVALILSHTGRYHHAFSHGQPGPTRKEYFDQLDTCALAMEGRMQEAIKLEKQLVEILDEVARRPGSGSAP